MRYRSRILWILLAAVAVGGAGQESGFIAPYDLTGKPAWQSALPAELVEISGLAFAADGRLFAHGDERGVVYRLDPRSGKVLATFALAATGREPDLGKKGGSGSHGVVLGDFEDIAVVGDRFFLVTSNGVLLEFKEGQNGARVPYTAHLTGLGRLCELEGLGHDAATDVLLLLCKDRRGKGRLSQVQAYAWSLKDGRVTSKPRLTVSYAELARTTGAAAFNGTAIAVAPGGKSFLLVAGPQQAFAEIGRDGRVLRGGAFPRGLYRQPEGAAFGPDGTLLIASEGAGRAATLAGYLPSGR
jgi:hypothetical protein